MLLKAVRKSIEIPLTIKIRTGWNRTGDQAFRLAEIAEASGVDAITMHPRTAGQGFMGTADWAMIAELKKRVSIPVIGNGDIVCAEDALKMLKETGCDAIMIGRAAMGNPSIFSGVNALLLGEEMPAFNLTDHFDIIIRYLRLSVEYFGEKHACYIMRSRLGWFVKGLRYSSRFRESIKHISTEDEALGLIKDYKAFIEPISKKI
jgi:tRNA-dihydrouridine synthase B